MRAQGLSSAAGREVWLKLESLQRTRAFKRRGACNALLALAEQHSTLPPIVTASAGNHGLALASVAQELGAQLTIHVPRTAPRAKLDRLRGAGITIVADHAGYDDAERRALESARDGNAVFISPYNHPDVIAGAGTVALEIIEDLPSTAAIIVPTGGGGLLAGVAIACDGRAQAVGVEPAVNPAFTASLAAGRTVHINSGPSLADGLLGNLQAGAMTFDLVRRLGVPVRLASEPFVVEGVRSLFGAERLVAEGAGAIAIGALLEGTLDDVLDPLVLLVTGANIDAAAFAQVIAGA